MKRFFAFIFIFCLFRAETQSVSEKFALKAEKFIQSEELSSAHVGIYVKSMGTKKMIYEYQGEKNFVPASLQKIILSVVALEELGADYTFKTYLLASGKIENGTLHGDLYLVGGGDPTLGSTRTKNTSPQTILSLWYQAILSKNIHKVEGNIYVDPSIFDNQPVHDSWMWGDIGNYYGAGIYGLSWHENMFSLTASPTKVGKNAEIKEYNPNLPAYITVSNQIKTGNEKEKNYISIYGSPFETYREAQGSIAVNKNSLTVKGALPHPPHYCGWSLKHYLSEQNIGITGDVHLIDIDTLSLRFDTLKVIKSPSLSSIIGHVNKNSNNVYAEAIFKMLGNGSYFAAEKSLKKALKIMGIETKSMIISDGSGLSSTNLVSPKTLCNILQHAYGTNSFNIFSASLSEAGVSGTLRNFAKNKPSGSRIYAKSGNMTGVAGYAGYVYNAKGECFCFAIMINNYTCSSSTIRSKVENLLLDLAE